MTFEPIVPCATFVPPPAFLLNAVILPVAFVNVESLPALPEGAVCDDVPALDVGIHKIAYMHCNTAKGTVRRAMEDTGAATVDLKDAVNKPRTRNGWMWV